MMKRVFRKGIIILVIFALLATGGPVYSYTDDANASLPNRIEGYRTYLNETTATLNEKYKEYDKLESQLRGIKAEYERLKRVSATQLYTVLLSFGIDVFGALTLNSLELMVNVATQVTEYQELVSGWSSKTAAQRAADSIKGRNLLAAMIPSYQARLTDVNDEIKPLQDQYANATSEIIRLMALYKTMMNEDYMPKTDPKQLPPLPAATVTAVISAPPSDIKNYVPGSTTSIDAANMLFETYKGYALGVGYEPYVLPSENWKTVVKVFDNGNGMERWMYEYRTPIFDPENKDIWAKSAVAGGILQIYIETQKYTEFGQTRYKAELNDMICPNTPDGRNRSIGTRDSLENISVIGTKARGQQLIFNLNVEDPTKKWFQTYWYARGKKDDVVQKDIYIGEGTSIVTDIPVDLYGFDELLGVSACVVDKFMGIQDGFFAGVFLNSGINENYSGISISQLYKAVPDQTVVMGGEIGLPEYGRAELVIDYDGKSMTFETIPTSKGAIVYADFKAAKNVKDVKAEVNIYAGSTKIARVPWVYFKLEFDKNYLSQNAADTLISALDTIDLELIDINKQIDQFARVKYPELLSRYTLNASYATTITKHIQGITDPNFQYTVQYSMDNARELIGYLGVLLPETGLGDQRLVNTLINMKTKGYPEGLAFIDVFYLHLKAAWLNQGAVKKLVDNRVKISNDLKRLRATLDGLQNKYDNSDHQSEINITHSNIDKAFERISDGAYKQDIMYDVFDEVNTAVTYLEGKYPEFAGYVIEYQKQVTPTSQPIAVTSVKLNKTTLTLSKGKTYKLTSTFNPSNASNKKVAWKSSNTKIATVSSSGIIKGIKKGSVYISVKTVSGSKSAKCKVTIK